MDEEEGFWTQIEKEPDNFSHHFAFAGWLEERDDPRAEGMHIIALTGFRPWRRDLSFVVWNSERFARAAHLPYLDQYRDGDIPHEWFVKLEDAASVPGVASENAGWYSSERSAYSATAAAFGRMDNSDRTRIRNHIKVMLNMPYGGDNLAFVRALVALGILKWCSYPFNQYAEIVGSGLMISDHHNNWSIWTSRYTIHVHTIGKELAYMWGGLDWVALITRATELDAKFSNSPDF